jgi:hypothetical protein
MIRQLKLTVIDDWNMFIIRVVLILLLAIPKSLFAQGEGNSFSVLFYNVENLFDPFDDTLTEDDEFTPHGMRNWTYDRFMHKLNRLFKVLAVSGGWEPPDMIALAEVENRWILEKLAGETPLSKYAYRIMHKDSHDRRGIDLAVLYRDDSFTILSDSFLTVKLKDNPAEFSRDIIYLRGLIHGYDTLHFLVNHWPSRYQGQASSGWKRIKAASILRQQVNKIMSEGQGSGIVITGDFNDEPDDTSLETYLGARVSWADTSACHLYNLSALPAESMAGTHKYQGRWYMFDQFIVSGKILNSASSSHCKILDFDFLMEEDEAYLGKKPFRTYYGYQYQGGFSDHLPVLLELNFRHPEP